MNSSLQDVLTFWFGDTYEDGFCHEDKNKIWFMGGEELDNTIKARFLSDLQEAETKSVEACSTSALEALAAIILLDQFSRNVYRGTAKAFSNDPKALAIAEGLVASDWWDELETIHKVFVLIPYEHSESLAVQNEGVRLMQVLSQHVPESQKAKVEGFLDYSIDHRDVIERFGRFPHRNALLGRKMTQKEEEYLAETGKYYGQK